MTEHIHSTAKLSLSLLTVQSTDKLRRVVLTCLLVAETHSIYTSYHHTITTTLVHTSTDVIRVVSVILNSHKTVKILFVCLTVAELVIFNWHLTNVVTN